MVIACLTFSSGCAGGWQSHGLIAGCSSAVLMLSLSPVSYCCPRNMLSSAVSPPGSLFSTTPHAERQTIRTNFRLSLEVSPFRSMWGVRCIGSLFSQQREISLSGEFVQNSFCKWLSVLAQATIGSTKGHLQFHLSRLPLLDTSARNLLSHSHVSKHSSLLPWRDPGTSSGLRDGSSLSACVLGSPQHLSLCLGVECEAGSGTAGE